MRGLLYILASCSATRSKCVCVATTQRYSGGHNTIARGLKREVLEGKGHHKSLAPTPTTPPHDVIHPEGAEGALKRTQVIIKTQKARFWKVWVCVSRRITHMKETAPKPHTPTPKSCFPLPFPLALII
jgi:hypothetical protein